MRHLRRLIHKDRFQWSDYGEYEPQVRAIADIVSAKTRLSGGWTVEGVINEAFYQATSLALDFSEQIYFESDYFNEAVSRMPMNVANSVFSVVYVILEGNNYMKDVLAMIENKLHSRPLFRALKSSCGSLPPIYLYPPTDYFDKSDYVDWSKFTEGFKIVNIERILQLLPPTDEHDLPVAGLTKGQKECFIARAIYGQANSRYLLGDIDDKKIEAIKSLLFPKFENQLLVWLETDEIEKIAQTPEIAGIIIPEESVNTFRKYSLARQENEKVKLANLELQNQLAAAQRERDEAWKQSEEYKKAVADMEQQLGKSSVQLNTIAKCILRFPTYELQKEAFDKVNSVLVGTSWNEKAEEVLTTMLENLRKKEEQDKADALMQPKNVIIKDSEVKIDSPQNVVYPQEGSTANIGCDQQNSTFPTFLPPASEVQGQIGNQKNEQKSLTEK